MAYDYSDLVAKTQAWTAQAGAKGWINQDTVRELSELDTRTPDSLFGQHPSRPLIVAFMGGSGVGKSTLLNRLAGKPIARTGIERPTSREVTLYHHHNVAIEHLSEQLPISQISIAQHDEEGKKNLIWIDMPDFDSTEQSNRQLVLQWLPHIDVLIYVVSPERYRDEKAWQLLLAEGARHAWLFVMNQWDRGLPEQFDDFRLQLHKAGFYEPVMFRTACTDNLQADEFADLEATINALATTHIVEQLEQRGQQLRKRELLQKLQSTQSLLGSHEAFARLDEQWRQQWQRTAEVLHQGFAWPLQTLSRYYAEHAADLLANSANGRSLLWDDWAQARFGDAVDEFVINASQLQLPVSPLKNQLSPLRDKAEKIVQTETELSARQALANPGNVVQRVFLKFVRICEIILPLTAMGWVGYQVFVGYYHSSQTNSHYLGMDFAIHSALLVALTWLVPFFILKKTRPSLEKSAQQGLLKGLENALDQLNAAVAEALADITNQHREQSQQLADLVAACSEPDEQPPRIAVDGNNPLNRMLVD